MIREPREMSADVTTDQKKVVLAIGKDRYRLTRPEAIRLADRLVDAAETILKETR